MLSISYRILLKRNLVHLEFGRSLGWILVMLQGLLVAFNLKQLSLFHYHRTQCSSMYSLKDGEHGIECAYRFRPYLMDRVIIPMSFFFFLSFCTSLYTFLREKTDDVLI